MSNAMVKRSYRRRRRTTTVAPYRKRVIYARRRASISQNYRRRGVGAPASRSYSNTSDAINPSSNWGSSIGGSIGSLFGPAGTALGSLLGGGAQSLVKLVTGFGDYSVNRNSLMPGALEPPDVVNTKGRGIIVRHREYISDVNPSVGFVNNTYDINPGLVSTFPWLSQLGSSFEQYCIHGMLFEFKSMSSDAVLSSAANTALGTVIMATQYNSLSTPFVDKRSMENYEFSNSAKPSESFIHPIECKGTETPVKCLYIRTGGVEFGDIRFYDLGQFNIATQGMQGTTGAIGELWVTFEIEFLKPKLLAGLGLELLTDHYALGGTNSPITNALPLGSLVPLLPNSGSSLGSQINVNASNVNEIIFPQYVQDGVFMLCYSVFGTGASVTAPIWSATTNCSLTPACFENFTRTNEVIRNTTTTNVFMQTTVCTITGPNAVVTVGAAGVLPTTVTAGDLWIFQFNEGAV